MSSLVHFRGVGLVMLGVASAATGFILGKLLKKTYDKLCKSNSATAVYYSGANNLVLYLPEHDTIIREQMPTKHFAVVETNEDDTVNVIFFPFETFPPVVVPREQLNDVITKFWVYTQGLRLATQFWLSFSSIRILINGEGVERTHFEYGERIQVSIRYIESTKPADLHLFYFREDGSIQFMETRCDWGTPWFHDLVLEPDDMFLPAVVRQFVLFEVPRGTPGLRRFLEQTSFDFEEPEGGSEALPNVKTSLYDEIVKSPDFHLYRVDTRVIHIAGHGY